MVSSPRDAMSVATRMSWWPSWNLSKTPCRLWKSTADTDILKSRLLHLFTHTHTNDNNNNENKNNDGDLEYSICNELNMLKKQTNKKTRKRQLSTETDTCIHRQVTAYRYSTVFIIVVLLEYHYSIIVVRCSIIIVHCSIIVILWYIVISLWYTVVSLEYLVVSIWYSVVSL